MFTLPMRFNLKLMAENEFMYVSILNLTSYENSGDKQKYCAQHTLFADIFLVVCGLSVPPVIDRWRSRRFAIATGSSSFAGTFDLTT